MGFVEPVGFEEELQPAGLPLEAPSGKRGLAAATLASFACLGLGVFGVQVLGIAPIDAGDLAMEREAPQEAFSFQSVIFTCCICQSTSAVTFALEFSVFPK